jgi:hypothetical protein
MSTATIRPGSNGPRHVGPPRRDPLLYKGKVRDSYKGPPKTALRRSQGKTTGKATSTPRVLRDVFPKRIPSIKGRRIQLRKRADRSREDFIAAPRGLRFRESVSARTFPPAGTLARLSRNFLLRSSTAAEDLEFQALQIQGGDRGPRLISTPLEGRVGIRSLRFGAADTAGADRMNAAMRRAQLGTGPELAPGVTRDMPIERQMTAEQEAIRAEPIDIGSVFSPPRTGSRSTGLKPIPFTLDIGEAELALDIDPTPPGSGTRGSVFNPTGLPPPTPASQEYLREIDITDLRAFTLGQGNFVRYNFRGAPQTTPATVSPVAGGSYVVRFKGPNGRMVASNLGVDLGTLNMGDNFTQQPSDPARGVPGFHEGPTTELEDPTRAFHAMAPVALGVEPGALGTTAIVPTGRVDVTRGPLLSPLDISELITSRAQKSLRSVGMQTESTARDRTVFLDTETGKKIAAIFGKFAVALLPLELSVSERAFAINALAAAERAQTGDRVIVPLGREQDVHIQHVERAIRNALSSIANSQLKDLDDGFLVLKPGGEQVLAAISTRRNRLQYADNYRGPVRRTEGVLPPDLARDVRIRGIMEARRQERIGYPHSTRAAIRAQFSSGQISTSVPGDFRGGRDIDRRSAFGPW